MWRCLPCPECPAGARQGRTGILEASVALPSRRRSQTPPSSWSLGSGVFKAGHETRRCKDSARCPGLREPQRTLFQSLKSREAHREAVPWLLPLGLWRRRPQLLCSRLLCPPGVRATWELVKNASSGVHSAGSEAEAPGRLVGTLGPPRPYLQGGPLQHLPGDSQLSSRVLLARRPIPGLDSGASTSP